MKKSKVCKVGLHITLMVLVVQAVFFLALFLIINGFMSSSTQNSAVNSLKTTALDRSEIIMNYVRSSEESLTSYLKAEQILALLADPQSAEKAAAAQKYTEDYGKDLSNLEGIYASSWDTKVLAHTNAASVGMITRPDAANRDELHAAMLAANGVYNTGIITSPASGEQIISMYKAVTDESGNPIGLGGIGIFTKGLVERLNALPLNGMPSAEYYLINAATGEYIFHPDTSKIGTVADEAFVSDIIEKSKSGENVCDYLTYSQSGTSYIAAYNGISDYNWVFVITDKKGEVFASAYGLSIMLAIILVLSAVILAAIVYVLINVAVKPISNVEDAISELGNLRLDAARGIDKYASRNDEIGSISKAAGTLCVNLKNSVDDISRVLKEIADENLTVDTELNKGLYVGDFAPLYINICTIKNNLVHVIGNINSSSAQVNSGSEQVAAAATALAQGSVEQASSVDQMIKNVEDINERTKSNSANCDQARELVANTSEIVDEVNEKMTTLANAIGNINKTSGQIETIMKTIEDIAFQTNILALNAAIEAARAGVAGKGFAVVADEVRNLAAKSSEAVQDTAPLIEQSVNAVNNGTAIMEDTAQTMHRLDEYTASVKKIITEISDSNSAQLTLAEKINADITRISDVVQANSATAEECAASAEELSGQSTILKDLIGEFEL